MLLRSPSGDLTARGMPIKAHHIIWAILFLCITGFIFTVHHKLVQQLPNFQFLPYGSPTTTQLTKSTTAKPHDLEQQVICKLDLINRTIPNVFFNNLTEISSGTNSTATILNYKPKYCLGDTLIVKIQMFNYLGEKKTYGGDFLRARIFSPNLGAAASGRMEDFNNGTYNVYFTLFWEGRVQMSILLMHPSEAVSSLWRARNQGYKNVKYIGKFLNKSQEVHTECGFQLDPQGEKCDYGDDKYGEFFYCMKLLGVPCEALISMRSENTPHAYLTDKEKMLFTRSNIGVEIPQDINQVDVVKCKNMSIEVKPKCQTGMSLPFPSGYFLYNVWYPLHCNVSSHEPLANITTCLTGKIIYLMGDSTLRQWIEYFPEHLKYLKFFDLHGNGWHRTYMAIDQTNNIYIQWKKHGHPFVTLSFFNARDYADVPHQIDQIGGNSDTVIVITLGQHFRAFPISLFIRRLLNVRKAIENLFSRSPNTKVIIKSENIREINLDVERFSDFHGYIQYLLVKDIFNGLNVGMIDVWDMTVAFKSFNVHPPEIVLKNQINMFLSYLC
ncbi:NXPE family member 1-like [Rana temporaria]|uniref:NXPE family member 1-like n=1 Tax=Rana temporaria TaxID=8407 RepID=UPI001AAD7462|nr:NXPE family member 1-like [Rana temporaria]